MKLTATQLRRIIKEEVQRSLNEEKGLNSHLFDPAQGYPNRIKQQVKSAVDTIERYKDGEIPSHIMDSLKEKFKDIYSMANAIQVNIDANRDVLPGLKK